MRSCVGTLSWLTLGILACAPQARADVGIALVHPTQAGASVWTQAGHASIYLSGVCAETPIKLRLCRPGEQGSTLNGYPEFDEPCH